MAVFRRTETECRLDVRGGTSSLPIFVNPFYELACPAIGIRDTWCRTRRQFSPSDCTDFEAVGGTGWMMDRQREIGRIRSIPSLIKRTAGIRYVFAISSIERTSSLLPRLNLVQLKIHQFMQTIGLSLAAGRSGIRPKSVKPGGRGYRVIRNGRIFGSVFRGGKNGTRRRGSLKRTGPRAGWARYELISKIRETLCEVYRGSPCVG